MSSGDAPLALSLSFGNSFLERLCRRKMCVKVSSTNPTKTEEDTRVGLEAVEEW